MLVGIDCGSYTRDGVNQVADWTAAALAGLGARVERRPDPAGRLGDTVVATFEGHADGPRALLIGHMDTVFDPGTAAERPFRVEGGRAYGPGVTDMKSGLLAGLHALAALRAVAPDPDAWLPFRRLVFIANPDEEIGSPSSTPHIRAAALESDVAFVLECARANGDIVSARKGSLDLRITVTGRAAHAGVEPEKGRNAILAAAHQVIALQALNDRWPGVTCNVGVIRGGTRPNVVAESVTLEVDLRSPSRADLEAAEAEVRAIATAEVVPDVITTVEEMGRHWPMEKAAGQRAARGPGHRPRRAAGLRPARRGHGRRLGREHDRRAWACRRSMAWDRSAATTTPPGSTSRSTRSCPGRRSWRSSSSPSAARARRHAPEARWARALRARASSVERRPHSPQE